MSSVFHSPAPDAKRDVTSHCVALRRFSHVKIGNGVRDMNESKIDLTESTRMT
jgi:hypothetical protein